MPRKKKDAPQTGTETKSEVWVLTSKPASPAQKAVRRGLIKAVRANQASQRRLNSWRPSDRPIGSSLHSIRMAA